MHPFCLTSVRYRAQFHFKVCFTPPLNVCLKPPHLHSKNHKTNTPIAEVKQPSSHRPLKKTCGRLFMKQIIDKRIFNLFLCILLWYYISICRILGLLSKLCVQTFSLLYLFFSNFLIISATYRIIWRGCNCPCQP